jgi:hypothetical protein
MSNGSQGDFHISGSMFQVMQSWAVSDLKLEFRNIQLEPVSATLHE